MHDSASWILVLAGLAFLLDGPHIVTGIENLLGHIEHVIIALIQGAARIRAAFRESLPKKPVIAIVEPRQEHREAA